EIEKDGTIAKDEVRDAIDRVRIDLPADVEPPIVSLINVTGGDMITFAVTADGWSEEQLSWYIDDAIAKRLFAVPGVGAVRRIGGGAGGIRVARRREAVRGLGSARPCCRSSWRASSRSSPAGAPPSAAASRPCA